jgi:DNA-binding winged helix-turn-helix (wHTH) protein/tetratricopeptide (TPR) repeat protein
MKAFWPFTLDVVNRCLWKHLQGDERERIPLTPKSFAVLHHLVAHAGRLVTHQEFLDTVWPGVFVQPEVLKSQILTLREALGDDSKHPRFIETRSRLGYRFVAAVSEEAASGVAQGLGDDTESHIVGRERELAALHASLRTMLTRRHQQMVFITGESGLGKTALVDEFFRRARASAPHMSLARGQCIEGYGGKEMYFPVLEALRELCASDGGPSWVRGMAATSPTWLVQFPALIRTEQRASLQRELLGATRDRMLRELLALLGKLTQDLPLLVVFEDLQWADASTIDVISALARVREPLSLLLIGTCRTSDLGDDNFLRRAKQELQVHRLSTEIALEPLQQADVAHYLAPQAQGNLDAGLAEFIHQHTNGVPLFIVAALEHLSQRGLIALRDSQWRLQVPLSEIVFEVPETLRDMIEARIERLSAEEQRALELGSVAGMSFSAELCADLGGLAEDRVQQICQVLARRRFILRAASQPPLWMAKASEFCVEFVHTMYREVLYRRQPPARRAALHLRLAQQLQQRFEIHPDEIAATLAHHFETGGDLLSTVNCLRMVARAAGRRRAPLIAEQPLKHALTLIPRLPETERRCEADVLNDLAIIHYICFDSRTVETCDAAIAAARKYQMRNVEIDALICKSLSYAWSGLKSQFLEPIDRALELSEEQDPERRELTRLRCSLMRLGTDWNSARADECRRMYDEVTSISDPIARADLMVSFPFLLMNRSEYREALRCARLGLEALASQSATASLSPHLIFPENSVPRALTLLGEWGEALSNLAANVKALQAGGQPQVARWLETQMGPLYFHAMYYEGAWALCEPFLARETDLSRWYGRTSQTIAGAAALGLGDFDKARALLEQVKNVMISHPRMDDWYERLPLLAASVDLRLQCDELEAAQRDSEEFLQAALATSERTWQGLAWDASARVALAMGDLMRAQECVVHACQCTEGFEVPLAVWRIHATGARVCGRLGDTAAAEAHVVSSAQVVRRLAASLEERADVQKAFLNSAPVRAVLAAVEAITDQGKSRAPANA